jgi:hypothetical protein
MTPQTGLRISQKPSEIAAHKFDEPALIDHILRGIHH